MKLSLIPHDPQSSKFKQIECEITISNQDLTVHYHASELIEDLSLISLDSNRKNSLWEGVVFEFFLSPSHEEHYYEFHMTPKNEWNAFRLSGYRQNLTELKAIESGPKIKITHHSLEATWIGLLERLPDINLEMLDIQVSCILEENNNAHYFAISHPKEKADFHSPDCFVRYK